MKAQLFQYGESILLQNNRNYNSNCYSLDQYFMINQKVWNLTLPDW